MAPDVLFVEVVRSKIYPAERALATDDVVGSPFLVEVVEPLDLVD
jgi:hypothetical protein